MKINSWHWFPAVLLSLCLGMARGDQDAAPQSPRLHAAGDVETHEQLDVALWVAGSAEYAACTHQTFNMAAESLELALRDKTWTASTEQFAKADYQKLPPAVMVDLDETVMNNCPYQSRLVFRFGEYDYFHFQDWRDEARCLAVPGAKAFLDRLAERNVTIIYTCPVGEDLRDATMSNLERLKFPFNLDRDQLLLEGEWPDHDKREHVAQTHRILLIVGNQLGDFMPNTQRDPAVRGEWAAKFTGNWGLKWFAVPNPMYGPWEYALHRYQFLDRNDRINNKLTILEPDLKIDPKIDHAHEKLDATLWVATAGEYYAYVQQVFHNASAKLNLALQDNAWTAAKEQFETGDYSKLPPAVIVNLDETVWNNTTYEARRILQDEQFDVQSFNQWAQEAKCTAVPGAKSFLDHAAQQHVSIIYISSRGEELRDATLRNLQRLALPYDPQHDQLLLGGAWEDHDKRAQAAKDHRILLIVSDGLSDFLRTEKQSPTKRREIAAANSDEWGLKWFIIPNPMYGVWEYSLFGNNYALDRPARIQAKLQALKEIDVAPEVKK